jgi:hypothetical protein
MGSTRNTSGVSSSQSERIRSRLRGALRKVRIPIPERDRGPAPPGRPKQEREKEPAKIPERDRSPAPPGRRKQEREEEPAK